LVHKSHPQLGAGGLSNADILRTRGGLKMQTSFSLFGAKKLRIFWNFWCVRMDKGEGGWASVDILRTRVEGEVNFYDFVQMFFTDRP